MQSFLDNLVREMRPVEVGRVNMVHARRDRLSKNSDGSLLVLGRPKNAGAGELHRAIAHSLDRQCCAGEREPSSEFRFIRCVTSFHIYPVAFVYHIFSERFYIQFT